MDDFFSDGFAGAVGKWFPISFAATSARPNIPVRLDRTQGQFPVIAIHENNRRLAPTAIYGIAALLLAISGRDEKASVDAFRSESPFREFAEQALGSPLIAKVLKYTDLLSVFRLWWRGDALEAPVLVALNSEEHKGPIHSLANLPYKDRKLVRGTQLHPANLFLRCLTRLIEDEGRLAEKYRSAGLSAIDPEMNETAAMGDDVPYRFHWSHDEMRALYPYVRECLEFMNWSVRRPR